MSWLRDSIDAQYAVDSVTRQNKKSVPHLLSDARWAKAKVPRSAQVDAMGLQVEVRELLTSNLARVFGVSPFSSIPYMFRDELNLAVDVILFRYGTYRLGASVGDRIQNLVMRDEMKAKALKLTHINCLDPALSPSRPLLLLHGVLSILVPYLLRKVQKRSLEENWENEETTSWKYKVGKLVQCLTIAWSTMSLVNFIHFLVTGQYRTLLERLLGLKMVNGTQHIIRLTRMVYLNNAVYIEAIDGLLSVLRIHNIFRKFKRSASSMMFARVTAPENHCCACHELPTISQRSNCGHLYCYYCIRSRLLHMEANGNFSCVRCGKQVTSCHPDGMAATAPSS